MILGYPFQGLKFVCQDMFFSRARSSPTSHSLLNTTSVSSATTSASGGRAALESAFSVARTTDDKTHVMAELVETKVEQTIKQDFGEEALTKRVAGYEHFAAGARMREKLGASGGVKVASDAVATRLAELKGLQPPEALKTYLI